MMETLVLKKKTDCREIREARDLSIYNEYKEIMSNPDQSKMMAMDFLCKKYGIHAQGTIYVILKRVDERLKKEAKNGKQRGK